MSTHTICAGTGLIYGRSVARHFIMSNQILISILDSDPGYWSKVQHQVLCA
jgi:hypothetical protein